MVGCSLMMSEFKVQVLRAQSFVSSVAKPVEMRASQKHGVLYKVGLGGPYSKSIFHPKP